VVYLCTLAPGVTFWDAGEFIAAAQGFGIPHPPGTPLYVALGRTWILLVGRLLGVARAMNLLSAFATAAAGALTARLLARQAGATPGAAWGGVASGLIAGLMCSAWANATETEVYAVALLHVVLLLSAAAEVDDSPRGERWLALTAYLIALAPAVHLSALVAAPAAIVLAARRPGGGWSPGRAYMLSIVFVAAVGVGRMSTPILLTAAVFALLALLALLAPLARDGASCRRLGLPSPGPLLLLVPLATSALLILLVRARLDPAIDQGHPATLDALADVVARRQYAVAGLWPRQGPLWIQAAALLQYADWQVAMGWGDGIVTSPARVIATLLYVALGLAGWRPLWRDARRLALALGMLLACGTLGVAVYLNLKAGASLGWGVLPDALPHEARERDYFFVLGFWSWACLAGWGALSLARRVERPALAAAAAVVLLVGNWSTVDRSRGREATAARTYGMGLLDAAPRDAVLFTAGDNDSYPLWYLQEVERVRRDVQLVTLPLLPAPWYPAQVARRTGLQWHAATASAHALWEHELVAAAIAGSARRAGRPVAASAALTARERSLLGGHWTLVGPLYVSAGPPADPDIPARVAPRAESATAVAEAEAVDLRASRLPDDVSGTMLPLLGCGRLGRAWRGSRAERDSLEERCNFR
jgi:hypothetical protein